MNGRWLGQLDPSQRGPNAVNEPPSREARILVDLSTQRSRSSHPRASQPEYARFPQNDKSSNSDILVQVCPTPATSRELDPRGQSFNAKALPQTKARQHARGGFLVIVEGIDATGKTTLARTIASAAVATYKHSSAPTREPIDEYADESFRVGDRVVFDRWHWGERVWPSVFGRSSNFTSAQFAYTERFLESRGAIVVHATTDDLHATRDRIVARGEDAPSINELAMWRSKFDDVARQSRLKFCTHSVEQPAVMLPLFVAAKRRANRAADLLRISPEYVGSLNPDVLYVCDEMLTPRTPEGAYLWAALGSTANIGVTTTPVPDFWELLGKPRIVAIGNKSAAQLATCGLRFGVVPRPQLVRSGCSAEAYSYALSAASNGTDVRSLL